MRAKREQMKCAALNSERVFDKAQNCINKLNVREDSLNRFPQLCVFKDKQGTAAFSQRLSDLHSRGLTCGAARDDGGPVPLETRDINY